MDPLWVALGAVGGVLAWTVTVWLVARSVYGALGDKDDQLDELMAVAHEQQIALLEQENDELRSRLELGRKATEAYLAHHRRRADAAGADDPSVALRGVYELDDEPTGDERPAGPPAG